MIELMVTVIVLGILVATALPSFTRMMVSDRMASRTNELVATLNAAKSEAIRRGQAVTVRAIDDANPNNFHAGWRTFTDANADGSAASPATLTDGTILRDVGAMAGTATLTRSTRTGTTPNFSYPAATGAVPTRQFITFTARGGSASGASSFFRICDSANRSVPGRIVQVSVIGRISLDSTTENCTL